MRLALLMLFAMVMMLNLRAEAAPLEKPLKVVIMEFGTFQGIDVDNLKVEGSEEALGDMVENYFSDSELFMVLRREQFLEALDSAGVNYKGSLNRKAIAQIHELVKVPYIVCGNVISLAPMEDKGVTIAGEVKLYSVRAKISMVLLDASSGRPIRAASGEGKSSSARGNIGNEIYMVTLGAQKISQISVANALKEAAENAVDELIIELSNMK